MKSFFKKYRILFAALLILISFFVIRGFISSSGGKSSGTFQEFCDNFFKNEVTSNTVNLHFSLKDPKAAGISSYDVTLGSYSGEQQKHLKKQLDELQDKINKFSYRSLDSQEKLTYQVLSDFIARQSALADYPYYHEILTPSGGATSQLPILLAEYEFRNRQDIEDYLTLLGQMDSYFSGILEYEQEKADAGLFMSDKSCMKVLAGCEIFTEYPDDNFLIETFCNRINAFEGLSDSEKKDYISKNETVIKEQVIPAYKNMLIGLTHLLGSGRNEWGLCCYKDGTAYYEALVSAYTGCDDGVESLFSQIESARKEDLAVCKEILAKDPKLASVSPSLDAGLTDETRMIESLQSSISKDFPKPPENSCEICHVDPALSEYLAPAFYITAPIDEYSHNKIYINDAAGYDELSYFTTLAHEGYPGHLYQTIQSYHYGLSPVRTVLDYPGYTEGWATYTEMEAYYYAGLPDELASLLQHNQAATLSLYATSDIGIHYYGWKKEDMIKFWSGYGISEAETIENITDLILEEPGNYLKYYVGYLKFRQLRSEQEEKLGDRFDPVKFHEAILRIGPAPFSILKENLKD